MSRINRPTLRDAFLSLDKRPEVHFYTSNVTKYLQARLVFERFGLPLYHFRSHADPYNEDYSEGKRALLARALVEIISKHGGQSLLFFVEDTSLRIEALSNGENDYPGLGVKEWFADTTFEQLDDQLQQLSLGRGAVVKSDIALHVPGLNRPIFFSGESSGRIADMAPAFEESAQYPWLTPYSFNGWFIPEGSEKRLGEMELDESWGHDFRVKALIELIDRLEEYAVVLNLHPRAYSRPHRVQVEADKTGQLPLFSSNGPKLVIVGRTCAGKTTFGEHAAAQYGLQFIEASSIMRMLGTEYEPNITEPFEMAQKVIASKGPDVVARRILQRYSSELNAGFVISGFRTIEEIEVIRTYAPDAKVVLVEASERIRFQRHLKRGRPNSARSLEEFLALDFRQGDFGLLRVAQDFSDVRITNEGTLQDYFAQIDAVVMSYKDVPGVTAVSHPRYDATRSQLYRCLTALNEAGCPLTCDEIEQWTGRIGRPIRFYNSNKVLREVPELARRLELRGSKIRYEILNPGRAYVRLMRASYARQQPRENGSDQKNRDIIENGNST